MQEQTDPFEQPDRFSDYLRQRLEDHRTPITADGWEDIHARLANRAIRRRRILAGGLLAAAVLTGLLWFSRPADQPVTRDTVSQLAAVKPASPPTSAPRNSEERKQVDTPPPPSTPSRQLAVASPPSEKTTPAIEPAALPEVETIEEQPIEKKPEKTSRAADKKHEATVPAEKRTREPSLTYQTSPVRRTKTGNRSSWLVAAGMGTGNNVSLALSGSDYANQGMSDSPGWDGLGSLSNGNGNNSATSAVPNEANYRDITYHLPLSFSLMIRKNLSPRVAVESGLIYTYLHNSYRSHYTLLMKSDAHIHYLGIPINGVVNLTNGTHWNIYLAAGFMAERSISAFYTNTTYKQGEAQTQTFHPRVKGLQWSVNVSPGVSYRFLRRWSLYAEPRFSYYFDNNQPETIRTEHPVTLGIGGGIRYEF